MLFPVGRIALVVISAVVASATFAAAEEPTAKDVRIYSGQVVDAQSGRGVAGVSLRLSEERDFPAAKRVRPKVLSVGTDAEGRFEIRAEPGWVLSWEDNGVFPPVNYAFEWSEAGVWKAGPGGYRMSGLRIALRDFETKRVLKARLKDKSTGRPIGGAVIRMSSCPPEENGERTVLTAADGGFQVAMDGECDLREVDGYPWAWFAPSGSHQRAGLSETPYIGVPPQWKAVGPKSYRMDVGDIAIDPMATMRVFVKGEDGRVVAGADVNCTRGVTSNGGFNSSSTGNSCTIQGDAPCVFRGMAGEYQLSAGMEDPSNGFRYMPAHFPEAPGSKPGWMEIRQGETRELTLVLRRAKGAAVRGKLVLPPGVVLHDGIRLNAGAGSVWVDSRFEADVQSDGSFRFDAVPAGSYQLEARFSYPDEITKTTVGGGVSTIVHHTHSVTLPVTASGVDVENLVLTAPQGVTVRTKLVVDEGGSAEDLTFSLLGRGEWFECKAKADGGCESRRLFAAEYVMELTSRSGTRYVVKRALLDGKPVPQALLDLRGRTQDANLEVHVVASPAPEIQWRAEPGVSGEIYCGFAVDLADGGSKVTGTLNFTATQGVLSVAKAMNLPAVHGEYDLVCMQAPELPAKIPIEGEKDGIPREFAGLLIQLGFHWVLDGPENTAELKKTRVRLPEDYGRVVRVAVN